MRISKHEVFQTKKGIGIVLHTDCTIANKKKKMIVETPVVISSDSVINAENVGAFTYFSGASSRLHDVKSIGRYCTINMGVIMGLAEQSVQSISSHFIFGTVNDKYFGNYHHLSEKTIEHNRKQQKIKELYRKTSVTIGNDVWIGHGAQILSGVIVGDGAVIAAGSVVTRNVPPYAIVGGVPAKLIRMRFPDDIIAELREIRWWRYGPEVFEGLDITNIKSCVAGLKRNIHKGMPEYACERFVFIDTENRIEHYDSEGDLIESRAGIGHAGGAF